MGFTRGQAPNAWPGRNLWGRIPMTQEGSAPGGAPEAANGQIRVGPAASREELEQAYRLVYSTYLRRGYIGPNRARIRLSVFNAFPAAITFVGVLRSEVIATMSLLPDTPAGLPMDEIYHEELQECRDVGRKLTEVTMLADRRFEMRRSLPMLLSLMKLVFDYATLVLGASDLCITINPRHDTFYSRYLLFTELGGLRSYPSVRNNPALARRLDLDHVREACEGNERLLRHFYQNRTPLERFQDRYRMTPTDLAYFFAELMPIFRDAPHQVTDCLRRHYPDCPWEQWLSGASEADRR